MKSAKIVFLTLTFVALSAASAHGVVGTHTMSAPQFMPFSSSTTWAYGSAGLHLFSTIPGGMFIGEAHPPSNAILLAAILDACDTDPTADMIFVVISTDILGNNSSVLGLITIPHNSGCVSTTLDLTAANYQVDNASKHLIAEVTTSAGNSSTSFSSVRFTYDLNGFGFPPTPFFNDVPASNPFFSFIQKMDELGITFGCGGGNYCPDAFVTRAQMAAFMIRVYMLGY